MSIGYGGICKKFIEDEEIVIYEYFSYNLNEMNLKNEEKNFDGYIYIKKDSLIEPELNEKFINKRKLKRKSIKTVDVEKILHIVYEFINTREIEIENCSNAWKVIDNGVDLFVIKFV